MALAAAFALCACDRKNNEAPPSVSREVAAPAAPDTPAGGSSGMKGSFPTPGSSGGGAVPGTSGSGISNAGGRSQSPPPGSGSAGGLSGPSGLGMTGSFPTGSGTQSLGAGNGSTNSTRANSIGNR